MLGADKIHLQNLFIELVIGLDHIQQAYTLT